jgi:aspartate kinase
VSSPISVRILSTFEPKKSVIQINVSKDKTPIPRITAITMRKNQVLATIKSLNMLNAYGFLANIFSILANHKVSVDLITTSEVSVVLTIDGINLGSHGLNPFIQDKTLIKDLRNNS